VFQALLQIFPSFLTGNSEVGNVVNVDGSKPVHYSKQNVIAIC
jgi:hypothetical protein